MEPAQAEPVWDRLPEIAQPVLVLCGVFDLPHIRIRSQRLAVTLAAGHYEDLADTAHLPQVEQPREVARKIIKAIR